LLDGVRVSTDPAKAPARVRNALYKNTYEDAERALVSRAVRPGDRVLEIGGGIGFVGLLCARLAQDGRVVSYEANPALEPAIRTNYALNDAVPELRLKAVSTDGGPVSFHVAENVVSSSLMARRETGREVTVASDAFSAILEELEPDVLVMDVEGAEVDLLPSADLGGLRSIILELHPHVVGDAASDGVVAYLREQGFSLSMKARANVLMERTA
jgi:FkbM family methyltransferase